MLLDVRRKIRQIVFLDGLNVGLEGQRSVRPFKDFIVFQFYVAPISGRDEQQVPLSSRSLKHYKRPKKCNMSGDSIEGMVGQLTMSNFILLFANKDQHGWTFLISFKFHIKIYA